MCPRVDPWGLVFQPHSPHCLHAVRPSRASSIFRQRATQVGASSVKRFLVKFSFINFQWRGNPAIEGWEETPPPCANVLSHYQRHAWNSTRAWAETEQRESQSARYCRLRNGQMSRMFRGLLGLAADKAQCADEVTCRLWRVVCYTQAAAGRAGEKTAECQSGPDAGGPRPAIHDSILSWSASRVISFSQAPDFQLWGS